MDLRREGLHSYCGGVRLRFQQRGVHEFKAFRSLNGRFFESVLVVNLNCLTNRPSSTARYSEAMECTLITSMVASRAPTDHWSGIPVRDLSTFCRSCSTQCEAVRSARFFDEFREGAFAGRVIESARKCRGGWNRRPQTELHERRVAHLFSDAKLMLSLTGGN